MKWKLESWNDTLIYLICRQQTDTRTNAGYIDQRLSSLSILNMKPRTNVSNCHYNLHMSLIYATHLNRMLYEASWILDRWENCKSRSFIFSHLDPIQPVLTILFFFIPPQTKYFSPDFVLFLCFLYQWNHAVHYMFFVKWSRPTEGYRTEWQISTTETLTWIIRMCKTHVKVAAP